MEPTIFSPHAIVPKKEPKIEPASVFAVSPTPFPSVPKTLVLTPPEPILSPLRSLSPDIAAERRSIRHFIDSVARKNPSPNHCRTHKPRAGPSSNSTALVPFNAKRKKAMLRSSDLQRVSFLTAEEAARIRSVVRSCRILYESVRTRLLLEDEGSAIPAGRRSRADLDAATMMKEANLWLNRERRTIGFIPGIYIGDVFCYRMELCVLGLHGQVQAGIDFVTSSQSPNGEPIATSIIVSGGYEDDEDQGDVLVYTGHGGREGKNETKHSVHQKLEGGNLALERSCKYGIEIRVIRGLNCEQSPTGRVYVYDGLYKVVKSWSEVGKSGFTVYKFKLVRMEGQDEMGSAFFKLAEDLKKNNVACLSPDISKGKENQPVAVINEMDSERYPLLFDYVVRPVFKSVVELMKEPGGRGCQCVSDCGIDCECVQRNGGEMPYDCSGRLVMGRPLVFECGQYCGCPSSCINRVSQKGLRHRLEIFRSVGIEWGVRSLDLIRAGEFVCEFSGILFTKEEAELAANNGTSLVYPSSFPRRWEEWGDLTKVRSDYEKPNFPPVPDVGYAINVSRSRNVACYLSHSPNPNVFIQFVLYNHYHVKFPRLMIFAMENIPPMRELSLDYGLGDIYGKSQHI